MKGYAPPLQKKWDYMGSNEFDPTIQYDKNDHNKSPTEVDQGQLITYSHMFYPWRKD